MTDKLPRWIQLTDGRRVEWLRVEERWAAQLVSNGGLHRASGPLARSRVGALRGLLDLLRKTAAVTSRTIAEIESRAKGGSEECQL